MSYAKIWSFLTRKESNQAKMVIPNKEYNQDKSGRFLTRKSNNINFLVILHKEIIQDKTREFSDKKIIQSKTLGIHNSEINRHIVLGFSYKENQTINKRNPQQGIQIRTSLRSFLQ